MDDGRTLAFGISSFTGTYEDRLVPDSRAPRDEFLDS